MTTFAGTVVAGAAVVVGVGDAGAAGAVHRDAEELDQRRQTVKVDEAAVDQALQQISAIRVGLGLPVTPPDGKDLTDVPPELDQNFSTVREALALVLVIVREET